MAKDMHDVVRKKLISSFKRYNTTVQDTILQVIGDRLQETYNLTEDFTEVMLEPDHLRPDIIKTKAKQYGFDIREEASLSEQIKLLEAINVIRSKRGSIESIEHMWKYYGGNLPKDVKVEIPAESLFRYGVSKWSGSDRFQDNNYYRSGVYTININGDYDLESLRDFINKELVPAGTRVIYNKKTFSDILEGSESSMSASNVYKDILLDTLSLVSLTRTGLTWSTSSDYKTWSGRANLLVDIKMLYEINPVFIGKIIPHGILIGTYKSDIVIIYSNKFALESSTLIRVTRTICTSYEPQESASMHFYDVEGNEIINKSKYPGYFILGESLLGEVI